MWRTAALDENERLTPLGRHLAALPTDIGVGRLLIYGALLRCAQPILLIAAALSDRTPFLSPMHKRDEAKSVQATFNLAWCYQRGLGVARDFHLAKRHSGQQKRAKFPTSKAPISAIFHSFRLIFGRAIISWNGLEAWMLFPGRSRAEHSR